MAQSKGRRRSPRARDQKRGAQVVFGRRNYVLLLIGVLMVVAGFVMMRLENEVDGFISLYVATLIIMGGYIQAAYAIMANPERMRAEAEST